MRPLRLRPPLSCITGYVWLTCVESPNRVRWTATSSNVAYREPHQRNRWPTGRVTGTISSAISACPGQSWTNPTASICSRFQAAPSIADGWLQPEELVGSGELPTRQHPPLAGSCHGVQRARVQRSRSALPWRSDPQRLRKVVAFLGDDGKPSATAYVISQESELDRLSALFGRFRTYQRSVLQVERLTCINFGGLADYGGFFNEERATGTRIEADIRKMGDIRV